MDIKVRDITLIALFTSLLFVVKYAFGFIVGFELVTFFVIALAIFLPFKISITTTLFFVMITGIMYGMGTWWIMYWFIFPTSSLTTTILKKYLKNNIIVGLWSFFWGFSILFWYALHDLVIFGSGSALASMSSALLPNGLGAIGNLVAGVLLYYPLEIFFKKINIERNKKILW